LPVQLADPFGGLFPGNTREGSKSFDPKLDRGNDSDRENLFTRQKEVNSSSYKNGRAEGCDGIHGAEKVPRIIAFDEGLFTKGECDQFPDFPWIALIKDSDCLFAQTCVGGDMLQDLMVNHSVSNLLGHNISYLHGPDRQLAGDADGGREV